MANIKISELNPLLTVADADVLPIVDNGVTKKVTAAILQSYTQGNSVLLTGAQNISGVKTFANQIASSVATGTAPFSVASTTKVTNLNADLLDGYTSADFQGALTLTTTGASGSSSLVSNTLNVPTYTLAGLGGVPYTGATDDVDLGAHELTTGKLYLYDEAGGPTEKGSLHYADEALHFENSDGETLMYIEPGFMQIHKTGTIQSNLFTTDLSATRDHYLPNASGTLALTSDLSAYVPTTRIINTTGALTGGGSLSGNLTLSMAQSSGSVNGYLSSTDWTTFNNKQAAGDYITALTGEATASGPGSSSVTLTNSAVVGKVLTGLNVTGGSVSATDSIVTAFGKVQNQINGLIGGSIYQGVWNASTNSPSLSSGVGTQGWYYIVNVAGSTNLDGITDWNIGDWAIFDGTAWQQVDNTDSVTSVNGFTGAVSLTTTNISEGTNLYYTAARFNSAFAAKTTTDLTEGTNLYFTDARARAAISLTTLGTSGAATYSGGVLNIPQYQAALTNPVTGTGTTNYLPKFTGTSALGDSLIYDNGTNVGIGTTSPTQKLQVGDGTGTGNQYVRIASSASDIYIGQSGGGLFGLAANEGQNIVGDNQNYPLAIGTTGTQPFIFGTSGAERMRITSGGQVQISSPISDALKLTNTNSAAYNGIIVQNDLSNQVVLGIGGSAVGGTNQNRGYSGTVSNIDYYLMTNNTERIRITSDGNVGIGTTSPAYKLDVLSGTNKSFAVGITPYYQPSDYSSLGGSIGVSRSFDNRSDLNTFYAYNSNNGNENLAITGREDIVLYGNGLEYARFKSNGNVGIGTTSPTAPLQVVGLPTYADNTTALAGGLTVGAFYHTGGVLKVVI